MFTRRHFLAASPALLAGAPQSIQFGVIGAGGRGRKHISLIKGLGPRARLAAIADPDEAQLARAAKLVPYTVAAHKDFRALLENKRLDVVVVATPNFMHREHAVAALGAGFHVFCEKPLATTVEDGRAIIAAAGQSRKMFLAGHQLRFGPVYTKMRELIREGKIGRLLRIVHTEYRPDWKRGAWIYTDLRTGKKGNWRYFQKPSGGTLVEKSCHFTDLYAMMTGANPLRAACTGGVHFYRDGRETMDHVNLSLYYPDGVMADHLLTMYHLPTLHEFRILGTEGAMVAEHHRTLDVYKYGAKPERVVGKGVPGGDPESGEDNGNAEMYEILYRAVTAGQAPPFPAATALDAVKACIMGETAAAERRVIEWDKFGA